MEQLKERQRTRGRRWGQGSLLVQWLHFGALTAPAWVQVPRREPKKK